MYYSIRHVTRFRYSAPITESVTEVRMQPRSEGPQRCLSFNLTISPRARVQTYRDHLGNHVHSFDIPGQHTRLNITAETLVEMAAEFPTLPDSIAPDAWNLLDRMINDGDYWDMLMPSQYAKPTPLLHELAAELGAERRDDPLSLLRELNTGIYNTFTYRQQSTNVDSPIDAALKTRQGVCQDYAHVMIALVRDLRIPCRYVSGYLYHQAANGSADRSAADATHAWVEALLPGLGWIGFDPTNNLIAAERHIRTAVGRDYADVPPTRGVFKGVADSELYVAVAVKPTDQPPTDEDMKSAYHSPGWQSQDEPVTAQQQSQQQQ